MHKQVSLLALLLACVSTAVAALSDSEERRYLELLKELRCVVCQNQSLAESPSRLAGDLRDEVHKMVEQGMSNEEIKRFARERYGDFVLYEPRLKPQNYVLWFAPLALLMLGLAALFRQIKKQQQAKGQGG